MKDKQRLKLIIILYVLPLVVILLVAIAKINTPNVHTWWGVTPSVHISNITFNNYMLENNLKRWDFI